MRYTITLIYSALTIGVALGEELQKKRTEPDAFRYRNAKHRFSLNLPSSWIRQEEYQGSAVSVTRPQTNSKEPFVENLNVVPEPLTTPKSLTTVLVENISQLRIALRNFELHEQGKMALRRGAGAWVIYSYVLDQNIVKSYQAFILSGSNLYVITGAATTQTFPRYRTVFQAIADSFTAER